MPVDQTNKQPALPKSSSRICGWKQNRCDLHWSTVFKCFLTRKNKQQLILFSWVGCHIKCHSAEAGAGVGLLFILPRQPEPQSKELLRELTTRYWQKDWSEENPIKIHWNPLKSMELIPTFTWFSWFWHIWMSCFRLLGVLALTVCRGAMLNNGCQ